ncbi:peptidase [Nocardia sp. NPDC050713]|uniref:peptidase n=1 Tax=Nocardia sp. NPDC050713 TaxID=3154511 RepID=UPI0033FCCE27
MKGDSMLRRLLLAGAIALTAAGCQSEPATNSASATESVVAAEFWSKIPENDQQRDEVLRHTRRIDVCALLPRETLGQLSEFGAVRAVENDQPTSCKASLGPAGYLEGTKLKWSTNALPDQFPQDRGTVRQLGDITTWTVASERRCSVTARFPAGVGVYLDIETKTSTDLCATIEGLVPGMLDRWRSGPQQGTSPDTAPTVLHGADPCAVRGKLTGTVEFGVKRTLNGCGFTYRDEEVILTYENRYRRVLTAAATAVTIDGHDVYRSNLSGDNDPIRTYNAPVGPDLPQAEPSETFGPSVPIVSVHAESDDVAKEVVRQALSLFS